MRNGDMIWIAMFALVLSACLGDGSNEPNVHEDVGKLTASLVGETKPSQDYYWIRRDVRRCASPACGGFFIALANRARTTCADGTQAAECYVAAMTVPFGLSLEYNRSLVHGTLRLQRFPTGAFGVFTTDAVLDPVLDATTRGSQYALAYDSGLRCIRAPCPTLALTPLNGNGAVSRPSITFVADDATDRAALEQAFDDEFASLSELGTGAVVFGRARRLSNTRTIFEVSNVYVTQPVRGPVCLVNAEDNRVTAWNFPTAPDAAGLIAGLTGEVELLDGRCAELDLPCTLEFSPVHGTIDALESESCHDAPNACVFRLDVIHAAGTDSKASGTWSAGDCSATTVSCAADADCSDGFCGWDVGGARICEPWAQLGEHCEGFVLPENWRVCAPGLECRLSEPTGDAGGVCSEPE